MTSAFNSTFSVMNSKNAVRILFFFSKPREHNLNITHGWFTLHLLCKCLFLSFFFVFSFLTKYRWTSEKYSLEDVLTGFWLEMFATHVTWKITLTGYAHTGNGIKRLVKNSRMWASFMTSPIMKIWRTGTWGTYILACFIGHI